ncbi:MAG: DMT family transporter [Curvibacter sp.]|jgi:drug/metabolite transporter (DMT)-like permease|nr:DMT family transporter [Curvibacter sp.]
MSAATSAPTRRAVALLFFSATLWGLSWWPLKVFSAQGLAGASLSLLSYGPVALCGLILLWRQRAVWREQPGMLLWLALVGGSANVAFVTALMQGEVVRVMLLFYLSPVWSVLGARLFLGEAIGRRRQLAVVLALAGLGAVLGGGAAALDSALSANDWLALLSGLAFAGNNLLARATPQIPMASKTVAVFLGGTLTAALMLGLGAPAPEWSALSAGTVLGVLAYGFLWLGLAMVTWQYGVTHLETGRAAVILITELVVAVGSSVLMGEEQLVARMVLGALLIGAAALLEATDNPNPAEAGKRLATE